MPHDIADPPEPPLGVGSCATLACIWEATAPKPGNVYRGADFDDLTYVDFLTSATVIGPIIERAVERGIGRTVLDGVLATRAAIATNSNLGMLLLLTPLAAVPRGHALHDGIATVLVALTLDDTRLVYEAIRAAQPGGLGKVRDADVHAEPPAIALREAMRMAADRDLVARQYVNNFAEVFWTADHIAGRLAQLPLSEAIVHGYLQLLAAEPDSLVARKCGLAVAQEVSARAAVALEAAARGAQPYADAVTELDFWLRADGHRRNPGTTADVIAAALFVLLREQRVNWPVRFYS